MPQLARILAAPLVIEVCAGAIGGLGALLVFIFTRDFETQFEEPQVLRDSTATVIAIGEDMDKRLLVNGIGMTNLTPVTKMMAHIPLPGWWILPQSW